jgi:magnesium transporter
MPERLQRGELLPMKRKDTDLLDDVFTEGRQGIGVSETVNAILSQMMGRASTISNNLNVGMKFSRGCHRDPDRPDSHRRILRHDVPVPFEDQRLAFVALVGLSVLSSVLVALVFWRKAWL